MCDEGCDFQFVLDTAKFIREILRPFDDRYPAARSQKPEARS